MTDFMQFFGIAGQVKKKQPETINLIATSASMSSKSSSATTPIKPLTTDLAQKKQKNALCKLA
jgi:hypothetical protein